ncbi:Oxygen regulatory protein NreC [Sinobacterium norvegicum]|uniref:Oxygen regulatory protein NreC n=1 Tax=Sinobacterium norvegicum TaxID=1641715 RepID=A0ABN8EKD6_9GAMM|nr:response regulator transcription factor [Sinobacterium norvegicum]CAH0992554.1 Oxygen regulatory protein NreC [Sinobacterium norvegicum]
MSKLLLADDHQIVAQGVASFLQTEHQILAIAQSGEELVALAKELQPEVIITDVSMGDMTGISACRLIKKYSPGIKVICLSMHDEVEYVEGAIAAGADGYVLKHQAGEELKNAIEAVLHNQKYITPAVTLKPQSAQLSPRQIDVIQLLAQGLAAKQVADKLCISRRTVEFHKYAAMKLLGVKTNAKLIQYAIEHGLVT